MKNWIRRANITLNEKYLTLFLSGISLALIFQYVAVMFYELNVALLILSNIAFVLIVAMTFKLASGRIYSPLKQIIAVCDKIKEGDIESFLSIPRDGELSKLGEVLLTKHSESEALIKEVKSQADNLAMIASQMSAISTVLEGDATDTSSSTNQISATIQELAMTSRQIADNANQLLENSENTLESAKLGNEAVEDTIKSIMKMKENANVFAGKVVSMSKKSQQIDSIVTIIGEIADQTRILALNAAIEAARAGEAGKGFSVVATEIRKLAESVLEAAKEINDAVKEMQVCSNELVLSIENELKSVEEGVELSRKAGEILSKIVNMMEQMAQNVQAIFVSIEQEEKATQQTAAAMNQIAQMAVRNAEESEKLAEISDEIIKATVDLRKAIMSKESVKNSPF